MAAAITLGSPIDISPIISTPSPSSSHIPFPPTDAHPHNSGRPFPPSPNGNGDARDILFPSDTLVNPSPATNRPGQAQTPPQPVPHQNSHSRPSARKGLSLPMIPSPTLSMALMSSPTLHKTGPGNGRPLEKLHEGGSGMSWKTVGSDGWMASPEMKAEGGELTPVGEEMRGRQGSDTSEKAQRGGLSGFAFTPGPPQPTASTSTPSPHPPRKLHPLSLSHYLSTHPTASAKKAISKTYPKANPLVRLVNRFRVRHNVIYGLKEGEMRELEERVGRKRREEAGWRLEGEEVDETEGGRERPVVSELFWKIYLSLLPTLERDPLSGLVAPPLLGSTTTMPLSIISLIPDIMRHYRDVIVRAEKEVFLVTNYWQPSNSVTTISGALMELSENVMKRSKEGKPVQKVIVKLVYDRGTLEQIWNAHAPVKPDGWAALKIPAPEEVPGLDLEVVNFHRLLLGTFHAKFLIVDRKVALINSNNIQDRPNLEMMTHLEGPIVDSFYETALHSWYNKLSPMLPCIGTAYEEPKEGYKFGSDNAYFSEVEVVQAAKAARLLLKEEAKQAQAEHDHDDTDALDRFREIVRKAMDRAAMTAGDAWDEIVAGRAEQSASGGGEGALQQWTERVRAGFGTRPNSRSPSFSRTAIRRMSEPAINRGNQIDMATLNSEVSGTSPTLVNESTDLPANPKSHKFDVTTPEKERHVTITEPEGVMPGDHDADEKARQQQLKDAANASAATTPVSATSTLKVDSAGRPRSGSGRLQMLTEKFNNTGVLSEAEATVEDTDDLDDFQPHVIHKPHKPFPVAMVNRKPHGMPGHHDIRNPQNAAWLAGCRYAQKKIFIQTPTLNARPIKRAIKQACRRGVEVVLYLDLGFNDKGESIPFQGGTNEEVVEYLYEVLRKDEKEQHLKVYWYTGKDQIRPLNAVKKQRNCHIKFAMFDDQVAILGNGNQDTQSWMHSQETNVMIDQPEIIAELMESLHTNQNTYQYGLVGTDGIWRDETGKNLADYDPNFRKGHNQGMAGLIEFAKKSMG